VYRLATIKNTFITVKRQFDKRHARDKTPSMQEPVVSNSTEHLHV